MDAGRPLNACSNKQVIIVGDPDTRARNFAKALFIVQAVQIRNDGLPVRFYLTALVGGAVPKSPITFGEALKGRLQKGFFFVQTAFDCVSVLAPASWKNEARRGIKHDSLEKLGELFEDCIIHFAINW